MSTVNGFNANYIEAAVASELRAVATAPAGSRNQALYRSAAALAGFHALSEDRIVCTLRAATEQNGLLQDDGAPSVLSTIRSGMRQGRTSPRYPPPTVRHERRRNVAAAMPRKEAPPPISPIEPDSPTLSLPARTHPDMEGKPAFVAGDDLPARHGELRRHVYRRNGVAVRVKIKSDSRWTNWYRVSDGEIVGWQAAKPAGYVAVPYVNPNLDALDRELAGDELTWCEGEKDVDTLARQGMPAFTFGGCGDGLPEEAAKYITSRQLLIFADNDDAGRAHAEKKADLAHRHGASVKVVQFPELDRGGDVTDFLADHSIEDLCARCNAAPPWQPSGETQSPSSPPARELVIRCAADIKPEPIRWLWRERIALGKLVLFGGEPGLGKSQLTASIAGAVTTGGRWPGDEGESVQGNVIFLAAEDDWSDTGVPRLIAAGADCRRVHVITAVHDEDCKGRRTFNLSRDLDLLEEAVAKIGNVRLIVIDPISSYLGPIDSHKNAEVRAVLEPIGETAARLGVAVIGITHFSKGAGTSANNKFIGSIAFVAAARGAFVVTVDPDDESRRLFIPSKTNIGPTKDGLGFRIAQTLIQEGIVTPYVCWDNTPATRSADEVLSAIAGGAEKRTAKVEAEEFLRSALEAGPMAVADLETEARAAGLLGEGQRLSYCKPIRAAAAAIGVERRRDGFGAGACYQWALPCVPSDTMLAHVCPLSKEGTHGTHEGTHGAGDAELMAHDESAASLRLSP